MIKIERYHSGLTATWNLFNGQTVNGSFIFDRTFIEYHGSRFTDHSLLFYRKNKLIALLPLHEEGPLVASHQGLSFGGLLISREVDALVTLQIFENLKNYLVQQGFNTFIYKAPPFVYLAQPAQDDLFALYQQKAILQQRNLLSVLDLTQPRHYDKLRQRCLKRAKEQNLVVRYSGDVAAYMRLVEEIYYPAGIKPTHTAAELDYLMRAFPENISLLTAHYQDELVGGVILFVHPQVVNLQYIATSAIGKQKSALDLLVHTVITTYLNKKKYLSFGSSHDERYCLNQNLVQNKSSYGARGVVQDTYKVNF